MSAILAQDIVVALIVAAAAIWTGLRILGKRRGKTGAAQCASCAEGSGSRACEACPMRGGDPKGGCPGCG
ncbi:MAG TPA: hypothetical protein VMV44_01560 [Rectinemataceae bacterium]|nr:hypothetical protein [Rectinemataceae bacterium]